MRWILVFAILAAATPPLIIALYFRSKVKAASGRASALSGGIKRKLLKMSVRRVR